MKDWFESMSDRERIMVVFAGFALIIAIIYLALWMPLSKGQKSMAASVDMWTEQLAELRPLVAKLQSQGGNRSVVISNDPLVVIVDRTVNSHRLANSLQRTQPSGNAVRVQFENAAFDDLVLWLGDLNSRDGLRVRSASFSRTSAGKNGRVNSTVTLER